MMRDEQRVLRLRDDLHGEDWEVPVEHAHAAFDRAVHGFDGARPATVVTELAGRRRRQQEPSGGR
jgi:hypothetical protein